MNTTLVCYLLIAMSFGYIAALVLRDKNEEHASFGALLAITTIIVAASVLLGRALA